MLCRVLIKMLILASIVLAMTFTAKSAYAASWVSAGQWSYGSYTIHALTTGTDGKIWAAGGDGYTAYWNGSLNGKIDSLPTLVIQEDGHFQLVNGYEQIYRHFGLKKGGFYGSK